jgi:protoporphyrinogen oxidase
MKIGIIGSGATGLVAGWELARWGHAVRVLERESFIGGLSNAVSVGEESLERFYHHHLFTSDSQMVELIEELGLGAELARSGVYLHHRQQPRHRGQTFDMGRIPPSRFKSVVI